MNCKFSCVLHWQVSLSRSVGGTTQNGRTRQKKAYETCWCSDIFLVEVEHGISLKPPLPLNLPKSNGVSLPSCHSTDVITKKILSDGFDCLVLLPICMDVFCLLEDPGLTRNCIFESCFASVFLNHLFCQQLCSLYFSSFCTLILVHSKVQNGMSGPFWLSCWLSDHEECFACGLLGCPGWHSSADCNAY